jgi:ferredoxin
MKPNSDDVDRLEINMIACEGVGLCVHLAPSDIVLDHWGYPIILNERAASPKQVKRAAAACPHRALIVHRVDQPASTPDHS